MHLFEVCKELHSPEAERFYVELSSKVLGSYKQQLKANSIRSIFETLCIHALFKYLDSQIVVW